MVASNVLRASGYGLIADFFVIIDDFCSDVEEANLLCSPFQPEGLGLFFPLDRKRFRDVMKSLYVDAVAKFQDVELPMDTHRYSARFFRVGKTDLYPITLEYNNTWKCISKDVVIEFTTVLPDGSHTGVRYWLVPKALKTILSGVVRAYAAGEQRVIPSNRPDEYYFIDPV